MMLAKKAKRAVYEPHQETRIPTQKIKRKKITAHLINRKRTQSLKNSPITKPFPADQAERTAQLVRSNVAIQAQVTQHNRMMEKLRKSEERYRTILEEMEEGYFETDLAGNVTFINDAGCKNLGYPREELIGVNNRMYADEENRKKASQAFREAYRTGQPRKILDYELTRKDGTEIIMELLVSLMKDSGDKPVGFRGIARHITELRKTEEALRDREEKYRTLLETMKEGYYEADLTGNLTFVNDSFLRTHVRENMVRMNYKEYMSEEEARRVYEVFNGVYKTGQPARLVEWEIVKGDGQNTIIEASVYLVKNSRGERIGFRGIERDITERKQAEKALLNAAQQWRATFDGISDIVCLLDQEGRIIRCNKAMTDLLGKPFGDIINRTHLEIVHGAPMPIEECPVERSWKTHRRETDVLLINDRWFSIAVDPLLDEAGRLIGAVHIMSDITERKRAEELLQKSEERYRTILEEMEEGYFETDLAGNLTFINDAGCKNLGYPREELIGKDNRQYADAANAKKVFQAFNKLYRTGEPCRVFDYEITRKDGTKEITELSASLMRDSEGKPIGFRGISRHVTERKRAEEAIRESEKRYRQVIENAVDIIYTTDANGNFAYANSAALRITGYSLEELQRFNYLDLILPEHRDRVSKIYIGQFRERQATTYVEFPFFNKSGDVLWFGQNASLVVEGGKPVGFHVIARDITERKRAEEALQKSEEKYRNVLKHIEEGYYEEDLAGNFTFFNDSMCRIYGYPKDELLGLNYKRYTDKETAKRLFQVFNEIYRTGRPSSGYSYELIRKDGAKRYIEASASLIKDSSDKPVGFRGIVRDVTERKRMEEALRQSEEKYRTILENMQEVYYEIDLSGNFLFLNDAIYEHLGYRKEELIGKKGRQYQDETTAKYLFQVYNKVYRTGEPIRAVEAEWISKDGAKRTRELSASLIRDSEGKPIGFRGVSRDITERKRAEEALRQSEERYRTILESIQDGYFEGDLAGNVTFVNDIACRNLGYSRQELLGMNYRLYTDEENARKLFQRYNELYRTGQPIKPFEVEYVRKDGTRLTDEVLVSLMKDSQGKTIGFRGTTRDITERKQAEEALRENEKRLRALMDASPIGISWADMDGNIKYNNPKFRQLFGYTVDDMPTIAAWRRLAYPDPAYRETVPSLVAMLTEAQKQGKEMNPIEVTVTCKDGSTRYVEQMGAFASNLILAIYSDLTAHKQAEEALRQSEERYRTIIENIQDGYFENDLTGNFTFVNDAECASLGYTRDELIGMGNRQYTDKETAKKLFQVYNELYRTGKPVKGLDLEIIRKDGTKAFDELSVSLIRDSEGKPIGFRGISRDITERKRAEEEKLSLQEQLRQSQKMEAIGQLAGGVAHDFNNLLTVIKGYSQLSLLDLKEDSPLWGNIQEIEKATQRATDLTRQLLAFSRRQILDPKVVDLNVLLRDMEKMLRRIIGEDIELVTLLSEDLGKVKIDPSQIEQVIFNLAVNARDAMPSGGKLAIETANVELDEEYAHAHVSVAPGRYVRLSVSDTGVGMTQEVKERVFEPFFTTKEKGKGTGLGLSMVYGIVKQSGGNIWLYSEPERGTTFRIYFPRTDEEADSPQKGEETDFFPKGSETILLVEDDALVRDLASRLLEQQGYRVLKAANGQEALLVAKKHVGETIHLLLADIVMPQMGGKELADWLKISRPNVKVLFTSGYADNAIVHHGVLDPGTHFLQKPFSLKTLSHKVREVLDG